MKKLCTNPNLINLSCVHSFFKTDFKSGYAFSGESHDWWEMVFVTRGSVNITAGQKNYIINSGQAFIHMPNEFHTIGAQEGDSPQVIIISFSAQIFPELKSQVLALSLEDSEQIKALYNDSFKIFDRSSIYVVPKDNADPVDVQIFWLRLELLVLSIVGGFLAESEKTLKGEQIFKSAVRLMEQNPDAAYSCSELAKEFSISTIYLKKLFAKYGGLGVTQYYNKIRVNLAASYLAEGRTVKETAGILGFGDQNHFSTFFKKHMGKSPTEYKKGM